MNFAMPRDDVHTCNVFVHHRIFDTGTLIMQHDVDT